MHRNDRWCARSLPILVSFLWLATCGSAPARAASVPHLALASPPAGARWVRPGTNLLVRLDAPLDGAPTFTATGARSGAHAGQTVVADGGRALIFRPAVPFAYGEHVTVTLDAAGAPLIPPYDFTTSAAPALVSSTALLADELGQDPATRAIEATRLPSAVSARNTTFALPTPTPHTLDEPAGGVLFAAPFSLGGTSLPRLLIQDEQGGTIFERSMPQPCFDFKVQPDGRLTYFDSAKQMFMALDGTYAVVDSFACGNGYPTDVHELRLLPNGHILLLGLDPQIVDMSQVVPGGFPTCTVVGNVIQELDQDRNVVFEWRTFDHFAITDATHENMTATSIDDVHANALEMDTDGNILMSSRHLDEITKIDHATGDILWRMGGKHNQFSLLNDYQWFSHQHAIRRIGNGDVTLFDNGNFHVPVLTRALEYQLDEVAKTATLKWEYDNPVSFSQAMGYVERLDDGSTQISFGTGSPDMVHVAPDGTVTQVVNFQPTEVSYRTLRQDYQPTTGVKALAPPALALSNAVPSPFHGKTSLFVTLAHASPIGLQVFDVSGRRVLALAGGELHAPGTVRLPVDLAAHPAGIYFARVTTNAGTATRRLVRLP